MATLRQSAARLLLGLSFIIICAVHLRAQNPQAPETRTGCLTAGTRPDTYLLIVDVTGEQLQITGLVLDAFKLDQKVTATGTTMRTGNTDVFQATKVEPINQPCQAAFSAEAMKRSIGKARIGVRGGVGFDPELIHVGVQGEFGPIFKTIWLRPSAEYGFGEVTQIASLNADAVYYLPFTGYGRGGSRWNSYAGGGPTLTFVRRNFEGFPDDPIEGFTDWDTVVGMNIFVGVAQSNGMFFEIKGTAWADPSVRLYVGWSFK